MARRTQKVNGVTVVLPKGRRKLTEKQKTQVRSAIHSRKVKNKGSKCRVVFFKASEPVMRCEGASLSTKAKRRTTNIKSGRRKGGIRFKGGKTVCRAKSTGRFRKC